ncbi:MAG TPA: hypothetical protein VG520_09170 [Candidatus Dormibacteraeota bacterium]|nr:hypothetical protein [Candidatus Dormibacteraeota bacterium]
MASIPDPPGHGDDIAGPEEDSSEYEVGEVLREGWGGTIRAGRYLRSGRQVTVEDIRADLAATSGLVDRLGAIGRQAAQLRDPHLLAVYDLVDDGGALRLVAEWSDAPTLASVLERGALPAERAMAVLDDALTGLVALHGSGLFHGRVGPDTVVIEADGRSRLAELAICAAAAPSGSGPQNDVQEAARLGLDLLGDAGPPYQAVRRTLEATAVGAGFLDAAHLREELAGGAGAADARNAASPPQPAQAAPVRRRRRLFAALAAMVVVAAAVVAALIVAMGHNAPLPDAPLRIGSDAAVTVTPKTGACNTTFVFVARGSLSGVGTLVYRWEQSDGELTADTSLPIRSNEGSFQLVEAWRLQGSQTVNGTMTLHILKPAARQIARSFRYSCP